MGMQPVFTQVPAEEFALDEGHLHASARETAPQEMVRPARSAMMIAS